MADPAGLGRAGALDASLARLRGDALATTAAPDDLVALLGVGDGIACGPDDAHTRGTVVDLYPTGATGAGPWHVVLVDPRREIRGRRQVWTSGRHTVPAELLDPATRLAGAQRRDWLHKVYRGLYGVVADGAGPLSDDERELIRWAGELAEVAR